MERIIHVTVDPDANGSGLAGFRDRDPGVAPATVVTKKWLNEVQESIVQAITSAGLALGTGLNQLWDAMGRVNPTALFTISGTSTIVSFPTLVGPVFALAVDDIISGAWSISSNRITVPSAGTYLVTISAQFTVNDNSDPAVIQLVVDTGAYHPMTVRRYNATNAEDVGFTASVVVRIPDAGSNTIAVRNTFNSDGDVTAIPNYASFVTHNMSITRLTKDF